MAPMPPAPPAVAAGRTGPSLLGQVAGWPLWLGGSVAGISALFYAAGYLLLHAHLNMLGIGGMVEVTHDRMLLEGARFFFSAAGILFRDGLEAGVLLAAVLAAVAVAREIGPVDRRVRALAARVAARHAAMLVRHPARDRTILSALLVALLYWHFSTYFEPLQSLGRVSSLLFRAPLADAAAGCPPLHAGAGVPLAEGTAYRIMLAHAGRACLGAGRAALATDYHWLLDGYLLLLVALVAVLAATRHGRCGSLGRIVRALLLAYAVVFTLLLPVGFGILAREPVYPAVVLAMKDGSRLRGLLIERDDHAVLLWDGAARAGASLPSAAVGTLTVTDERNLFERLEERR